MVELSWAQCLRRTKEAKLWALTHDLKQTAIERIEQGATLARALLDEAATLFLNGGRNSAPLGCEQFAIQIGCPRKSLSRMLSSKGNPSMDNLAASFGVMCRRLGVALQVNVVGQSI